jgi:hypothetical protein
MPELFREPSYHILHASLAETVAGVLRFHGYGTRGMFGTAVLKLRQCSSRLEFCP